MACQRKTSKCPGVTAPRLCDRHLLPLGILSRWRLRDARLTGPGVEVWVNHDGQEWSRLRKNIYQHLSTCINIYQHSSTCITMHQHASAYINMIQVAWSWNICTSALDVCRQMWEEVSRLLFGCDWKWMNMGYTYIYISIIHCVLKKDSAVAFGLFPSFSCWPKAAVLAKDAELLRRLVSAASLTPRMSGGTYHGGTFESCLGLSIINHPPIYWGIPILGNLKF